MRENNLQKVFQATKKANSILSKAGGIILKSSLQTTKQIAGLYKDAGLKAFSISKELVKKTVELTVNNQKEILKTSGEALKEVAQQIILPKAESQSGPNGKMKKSGTKKRQPKVKKEISIDDLLESPEA